MSHHFSTGPVVEGEPGCIIDRFSIDGMRKSSIDRLTDRMLASDIELDLVHRLWLKMAKMAKMALTGDGIIAIASRS